MKHTVRTVSILMILLVAMLVAVSCKKNEPEPEPEQPFDIGAIVAGDEGSVFTIVYPSRWTEEEYAAAQDLKGAFEKKYQSIPALKNDSTESAEDAYEILVGNTNRAESAAAVADLNDYGWTISVIGNRIVINAKNNLMITEAVEYFIANNIGKAEKIGINSISAHVENQEKYNAPYVLSVAGRSVYTVSYSSKASDYLKSAVMDFSRDMKRNNVVISTKGGSASGKAVTLTTSSAVNGWEIVFEENGNITLKGQDDAMAVNALNYFAANVMKKDADGDILVTDSKKITDTAEDYAREGWLLAAPAYEGGMLSMELYNCGTGVGKDNGGASSESSYMICVAGTSHSEFQAYLEKLSDCGYRIDSENVMQSPNGNINQYLSYKKDYQYLYVYYLADIQEVRIIEDRVSTLESEFEYTFEYDSSTGAEIYMYGMKSNPTVGGNGAFMIIKQADNSVILIDGGSGEQATSVAVEGLLDFLQMITGKSSKEKVVVSCWFITHAHEDHFSMVAKLMSNYTDKMDVQRVMFNFPKTGTVEDIYPNAREAISTYFPGVKVLKCHAGQSIRLGSVVLDVLTTHEDAVQASTGRTQMTEGNSMTTVIRVTLPDGTRFMSLGDYTAEREEKLLKTYAAAELKCQITDVAHHGYNSVPNIYKAVGAKYALWTNYENSQFSGWHLAITNQVKGQLQAAGVQEIYYAGLNTVKLECKGGTVQVTKLPMIY